jgi:hypothetical protein
MFLIDARNGELVRVEDFAALSNPFTTEVMAREQAGEEEQNWSAVPKEKLTFPSGEPLPLCWMDPNFRLAVLRSAIMSLG